MKVIGKRVSILKDSDLLSIVVLPDKDKRKMWLLFGWLVAWSVCGVIVFAGYFRVTDKDARLFIIIYLSFWAYFEFNILKTFNWRRGGKEKLWIQGNLLYYQREINGRGKIRKFNTELVKPFELVTLSRTSLSDTVNQSYWVRGGERVQFSSQAETIRLGMQLSDEEARAVVNEVNRHLRK